MTDAQKASAVEPADLEIAPVQDVSEAGKAENGNAADAQPAHKSPSTAQKAKAKVRDLQHATATLLWPL